MRICDDLRQAVLQAAIQGKLTKQLPEDGNAADLLKQIAAEKAKLIKEGKIQKGKPLPVISPDEIPFDIPDNWRWVRFGDITTYGYATKKINVKNADSNKWLLDLEDIEKGGRLILKKRVSDSAAKGDRTLFSYGNILYSKLRPYLQKILIADEEGICTPELVPFGTFGSIDSQYVVFFLLAPYVDKIVNKESYGVKMPRVNTKTMVELCFPLPPLAEQQRIVAKVDELMAQIDDLEKTETELENLKAAFPGDMKAALLQAAMQGKLTEQLPEDGDAADLLKQIAKEKSQLIKEGKIKKEKPLPEISPEEVPFDIPDNWQWVRLGSIIFNRGQKTPDTDFTYIDIGSIDNKANKLGNLTNILSPGQAPSRARKIVQSGDIIYSTVRPYLHNTCIIDREIIPEPIVSTGFAVLSVTKGIYNQYLFRCLLSPMFDAYANSNENAKGVAYPAINDNRLMSAYIPLPPLAEQKRIVEKLDKLLPLCDGLIEE